MSNFISFLTDVVINTIIAIVTIMSETTTIQISKDTRDELKTIGKMGDDYNTVIRKLIHEHNCNKLIDEGNRLIREHRDEFVSIDDL
jgi:hypothetical protein